MLNLLIFSYKDDNERGELGRIGDAHEHTPLPSPDVPKHPEGSASQATKGFLFFHIAFSSLKL